MPTISNAANTVTFEYSYLINGNICVDNCVANESVVIIPSNIDGRPVTSLANNFLANTSNIYTVIIPDSVNRIGDYAFCACHDLEKIKIPKSLKEIPMGFCQKTKLTSVKIPDSVTVINPSAFCSCFALSNVEVGENLREILCDAFSACNFKNFRIGPKVENISFSAGFLAANICLESITVDENNQYFRDIDGILFSKDGSSLIRYPEGKKDENYKIPISVERIRSGAFFGTKLNAVEIHKKVKHIASNVFNSRENINLKVQCKKGSYAEDFAKRNHLSIEYCKSKLDNFLNTQNEIKGRDVDE